MKLFVYEWKKIFHQKSFLMLLLFGAILNVVFLNFSERFSSGNYYTPESYRQIWDDLDSMTDEEAYSMLETTYERLKEAYYATSGTESNGDCVYTGEVWTELQLLEDVREEVNHAIGYTGYLESIQEDAKGMLGVSIFREESAFSTRNIEKTVADFEKMMGVQTEASRTRGTTMATGFLLTDLIGVLLVFVLCVYLVLYEKQTGQFALISPTVNGRRKTIVAKIGVLFSGVCIIYFILYGGNVLSSILTYGIGDFSNTVQSIPTYQSCTLMLSVGGYFALFTGVKILLYFMVGLLILFLCLRLRTWLDIIAVALGIFGGSFAASYLIPENSALMSVKYLNLVSFLQTDQLLMDYQNINLFGYPVSLFLVASVVIVMLIVAFLAWILVPAERHELLWNGKQYHGMKRKAVRLGHTLGYFELLKARKKCGLAALFMLLFVLQLFRMYQYSFFNEPDEVYYRVYMDYLSGLTDSEVDAYVEEENARYHNLLMQEVTDENSHELHQEMLPYKGWTETLEEYERVRQDGSLTLVYSAGYLQLMGEDKNTDMVSVIVLMLFLILCLSGIFAGDHEDGMDSLLAVTTRGRRDTLHAKRKLAMKIAVLAFDYVCISDFLMFYMEIGMHKAGATLQSIKLFAGYTGGLKIWQYLVILYLMKLLGMIAAVHGICIIAELLQDTLRSVLLSIILFVLPPLLTLLGMDVIGKFTLLPLLAGNTLLNQYLLGGNLFSILPYLICAVAGVGVVSRYLNKRYSLLAGTNKKINYINLKKIMVF